MNRAALVKEHQAKQIRRLDVATTRALRVWKGVDPNDLDASWVSAGPKLALIASAVQQRNAEESRTYLTILGKADGMSGDTLTPEAFTGVDGSGRPIESLLFGAVTTVKKGMTAGLGVQNAFQAGATYLTAMLRTGVMDLARASDGVAAAGRGYTQYVRVVNPGACDRCAILAGVSDYSTAFKRHPSCRCTSQPINKISDGVYSTDVDYFNSLSPKEQERVFTKAGAEAIRLGADPAKVVSARRGATGISYGSRYGADGFRRNLERSRIGVNADGSPIWGYVTSEGTTARGWWAKGQRRMGAAITKDADARLSKVTTRRFMPETIMGLTNDPQMRRVLLRDAGYLNDWGLGSNLTKDLANHETAIRFYKSKGIRLATRTN